MGLSANAAVGFGVLLEEYTDLPWNSDEFDGDFEAWWRAECGWTETRPDGEWESDAVQSFYARRDAFDEANPPPVVVDSYGWGDYRVPILLVPGAIAGGGEYAGDLDVSVFATVPDPEPLLKFCEEHEIEIDDQKPRWLIYAEVS